MLGNARCPGEDQRHHSSTARPRAHSEAQKRTCRNGHRACRSSPDFRRVDPGVQAEVNRSEIRRSLGALTRRELMSVGLGAAALPAAACSARASPSQFTPEQFGASGDGLSDDYDAFQRLAAAINESAGGILVLRPGAHYLLNRYVSAGNGVADVTFQGCSGLAIRGNSASISVKGDFFRTALTTRSLAGLRFE